MTYKVKSIRALIDAHRFFASLPNDEEVEVTLPGWFSEHWTPQDFTRWFLKCLNEKINRGDKRHWRCLTSEYQSDLRHDVRIIRDYSKRIRSTGSRNLLRLPKLKNLYPHIDNQSEY